MKVFIKPVSFVEKGDWILLNGNEARMVTKVLINQAEKNNPRSYGLLFSNFDIKSYERFDRVKTILEF